MRTPAALFFFHRELFDRVPSSRVALAPAVVGAPCWEPRRQGLRGQLAPWRCWRSGCLAGLFTAAELAVFLDYRGWPTGLISVLSSLLPTLAAQMPSPARGRAQLGYRYGTMICSVGGSVASLVCILEHRLPVGGGQVFLGVPLGHLIILGAAAQQPAARRFGVMHLSCRRRAN